MASRTLFFILSVSSLLINGHFCQVEVEQVHLSLGTDETEMLVTWTVPEPKTSKIIGRVHYYPAKNGSITKQTSDAELEHFQEDLTEYLTFRALLRRLLPNTTYNYKIEILDNQNSIISNGTLYQFRTFPPSKNEFLPRFAIYGDLGYVNEQSLPYLKKDVQEDMFDVIFHVGDIAYDLPDENGWTGHRFMRSIEPIASKIPYQICPGNHEEYNNFSHYDSRFSMIADRHHPNHSAPIAQRINNHFHSMDIGPAHIIMFSTEYYYFTEYGWDQIERQYRWLEQDLIRANQNRRQRPWIIVMGHRPLYCVTMGDFSCNHRTMERETIRQGIHWHRRNHAPRQYGLEDLFYKYGVDIQFYGHEHFYARMLPMYNYTDKSGQKSANPYDHPEGPIHITTGSAGNKEFHPPFNHLKKWVGCHFLDYGYTRLIFKGEYHIRLEQVSDDRDGQVSDEIDIIKSTAYPRWMVPYRGKTRANEI